MAQARELTERQWAVIEDGRRAMRQVIAAAYPGDRVELMAAAVVGELVTICQALTAPAVRDIVQVVNRELAGAGLELRHLRRN